MRTSARARVKCLVGLVVAVGLVSMLSPLPFTSSAPRLIGLNTIRSQTTLNPIQRRGEEKRSEISESTGEYRESKGETRDNIKNTGKYNEDTGVYDKKPGGNDGNFEDMGKYNENTGGNNENLSGKRENLDGNDKLVKNNENGGQKSGNTGGNQGGKDGTIGEGSERSSGNQNNANSVGKISGNKVENNENQDKSSANKGSVKSRVENEDDVRKKEEEEKEEEEVDLSREPYIENIPPAEWVEVKKTNPKERGGGVGGLKGETEKGKSGEGGKELKGGKNEGSKEGKGGRKEVGKKRRRTKGTWKMGQGNMKSYVKPTGLSHRELQERAESLPESSPVRAFLAEQRRRVGHVAASCRSFQTSLAEVVAGSRGPPVGLMAVRDIIFDRTNQLTFCPVYKAASTSLTITMLQLAGYWTPRTKTQPLQKLVKMFYPKLSGLAAASITANTTHFMVVRHPLERLLSCYRDKFQLAAKDYYYHMIGEKVVRRYREALQDMPKDEVMELQQEVRQALSRHRSQYGEDAGAGEFLNLPHNPFANPVGPTFPEFAQHVADTKNDDEHWRSYTAHCAPCTLTYDFVLRFESLQQETELFLDYLDRRGEVTPRWDNPNKKAETSTVFCQYYSQLPLALIDRLVEKYRRDLIMFEYDVEDYRKCAKEYQSDGDGVTTGGGGGGDDDGSNT